MSNLNASQMSLNPSINHKIIVREELSWPNFTWLGSAITWTPQK